MSASRELRRGDLVSFAGVLLYCDPCGDQCYLYQDEEHVGKSRMAVFIVLRASIAYPPDPEARIWPERLKTLGLPLMQWHLDELVEAVTPIPHEQRPRH